ncbi:MAG: hypothetical protein IJY89_04215, partial [Clostridia bacterium]|nr:hypothetical protein [Clostridia bacterium]
DLLITNQLHYHCATPAKLLLQTTKKCDIITFGILPQKRSFVKGFLRKYFDLPAGKELPCPK